MVEKKKMDPEKKMKLIYSIELLAFAIIFLVLGILLLVKVIQPSQTVRMIFNFVTVAGGIWMIANFFWTLLSPKKRAKTSLLDVTLMVPLAIGLIAFDIYCFVIWGTSEFPSVDVHCLWAGIFFIYIAVIYAIQGIYHYSHPIPGLLDDLKEDEEEKGENNEMDSATPEEEVEPHSEEAPMSQEDKKE